MRKSKANIKTTFKQLTGDKNVVFEVVKKRQQGERLSETDRVMVRKELTSKDNGELSFAVTFLYIIKFFEKIL